MADMEHLILEVGMPLPEEDGNTNSYALNDSDDAVGGVFQAPSADDITHAIYHITTKTGSPPNYKAVLYGVDSSGVPDTGSGALASVTLTGTDLDTGWHRVAFDSGGYTSVVKATLYAVVIEPDGTTPDTSNYIAPIRYDNNHESSLPFVVHYTSSWVRTGKYPSGIAVENTAGDVFPGGWIIGTEAATSAGDYVAAKENLTADLGTSFTVAGFITVTGTNATTTLETKLMDDSSGATIHQNYDHDMDATYDTVLDRPIIIYFDEATLTTLNFGDVHYCGWSRSSGSQDRMAFAQFDSADRKQNPYMGEIDRTHKGEQSPPGAWSDTSTRAGYLAYILEDVTA
jgi:hypothetical protein